MKKVQMFFLAAFAIAGFMLLARPAKLMAATTAAGECPRGKSEIKVMHGVMEKDETWTSDHVYMVIGRRSTGKHTLNIEAGTTVCFTTGPMDVGSPRGNISVDGGGTLNINGTAQNHVTLTRWYDLSVGEVEWMGIDYGADVKKPGTVQYADFYYAGSSGAGFIKTFGDPNLPPLDFRNVTTNTGVRAFATLPAAGLPKPASTLPIISPKMSMATTFRPIIITATPCCTCVLTG